MEQVDRKDGAGPELPSCEEAPPPGVRIASRIRWAMLALVLLGAGATALVAMLPREGGAGRFHCPMHPTVVSQGPGDCPICGMDLVPIADDEQVDAGGLPGLAPVEIPPDRLARIGVRTGIVQLGSLGGTIRSVGVVATDESRRAVVQTRFSGWVEKLLVDQTGVEVKEGQPLARIYGPELYRSQVDYVNSLKYGGELLLPAEERLRLLGIGEPELAALRRRATPERAMLLRAPLGGHVMHKGVVAGSYVGPGTILFEIADLSRVWILADVYERDLDRVTVGAQASFLPAARPGEPLPCRIAAIYPTVEPATRTMKVRLEIENPALLLRPGMFGEVRIEAPSREGPIVDRDAVIETGERVYALVARGGGRFEPREVRVLARDGDRVLVDGLAPGEQVVTSAGFFVDSESRLKAALGAQRAAEEKAEVLP